MIYTHRRSLFSLGSMVLLCVAGCGSTDPNSSDDTGSGTAATSGGGATEHFSFFVTSLRAMQELSGSPSGFGGDLRFGETGAGAGLRGADKICATIADKSLPGAGKKQWRAFLSAVAGEDGKQVNAIDRVGEGPWYDRLGRLVASSKADVLHERPEGVDAAIKDDLSNEDGFPNHQPDPTQPQVDNHDTLTGTNEKGELYSPTATCKDWTSALGDRATEGKPRVGHSWSRMGGPGGGMVGMVGMVPQELVDACKGLVGGDACKALLMGMEVSGECSDFKGSLFCASSGGSVGGPSGSMDGSMANWMSSLDESGCAPGVNLVEMGPPQESSTTVGSGGGYGGIYCFALTP